MNSSLQNTTLLTVSCQQPPIKVLPVTALAERRPTEIKESIMHAIHWFDLYVNDFQRARRFYETALDVSLEVIDGMGGRMGLFPADHENGVGGSIVESPDHQTGAGGTRVYLNAEGKLDAVLDRVPGAGGEVLQPRTSIAPHGFIAVIKDSEGNPVGLHSMS